MGIPGAGKSRLAEDYVARGYVRLNRDERGGSLRELARRARRSAVLGRPARRARQHVSRAGEQKLRDRGRRAGTGSRRAACGSTRRSPQAQVNLVARLLGAIRHAPEPGRAAAAVAALSGSDDADVADAGGARARTTVARRGVRGASRSSRSCARAGAGAGGRVRRRGGAAPAGLGGGGQQRRRRTRHIWCSTGVPERRWTASPACAASLSGGGLRPGPGRAVPARRRPAELLVPAAAPRPAARVRARGRTSSRRRRSSSARGRPIATSPPRSAPATSPCETAREWPRPRKSSSTPAAAICASSNPDRVIFPSTERTAAVTKLDIVNYYLAVDDGIMRALERRPTTLERWPKGVHPGHRRCRPATGAAATPSFRSGSRGAPRTTCRRRGSQFPSGREADEVCPTEIAVVGWAAQMGTITFHPWPVRREDVDHPDELRLDLDPQPGTDFADAARVAGEARALLDELGYVGFPKTSGGRGVHIYVRIEPRWTFTDVRHAAIALRARARAAPPRPGDDQLVEGGARRAHLHRLQPERARPHDRLCLQHPPEAGRAGLGAARLGRAPRGRARGLHGRDDAGSVRRAWATVHAAIDDVASLAAAAARPVRATSEGSGDMPYPPDYPKMPGEPKRVQPSRDRDRPR